MIFSLRLVFIKSADRHSILKFILLAARRRYLSITLPQYNFTWNANDEEKRHNIHQSVSRCKQLIFAKESIRGTKTWPKLFKFI